MYLNMEHGHQDPEILSRYAGLATICQAVTDPAQKEGDAVEVAMTLLGAGVDTALVTLAGDGCLVAHRGEVLRVGAPRLPVVDACCAGATFSTGVIYGILRGWTLEEKIRFATAAASLKCTVVGPRAFPIDEIKRVASTIQVTKLSP